MYANCSMKCAHACIMSSFATNQCVKSQARARALEVKISFFNLLQTHADASRIPIVLWFIVNLPIVRIHTRLHSKYIYLYSRSSAFHFLIHPVSCACTFNVPQSVSIAQTRPLNMRKFISAVSTGENYSIAMRAYYMFFPVRPRAPRPHTHMRRCVCVINDHCAKANKIQNIFFLFDLVGIVPRI